MTTTENPDTASDATVKALFTALDDANLSSLIDFYGEPISVYTREQMIADGGLFPLPEKEVREQGFSCYVDATAATWHDAMLWTNKVEKRKTYATGQDTVGRVWDVLTMLRVAMRGFTVRNPGQAPESIRFPVMRVPAAGRGVHPRKVILKAVFGADHFDHPSITIMMPDED